MINRLKTMLSAIEPVDKGLLAPAKAHLDNLTKPLGSLGRLEDIAARLYMISGGKAPCVDPARIFVCAGDHGVAAEGVSPFPQEVTRQMVANFLNGGAGINVLAKTAGIDLTVVDAGCAGGPFPEHPMLANSKIAQGTANLAEGPAMTMEQCAAALVLGIELADEAAASGVRCLGTGDMGIANTTPSTALYCAFLGLDPETITGPGAGLDAGGVSRKAKVIAKGLAANADALASGDPLSILAALGGLEIACLAGIVLGAAKNKLPVAVDGFISTAACVSAVKLCPAASDYAFYSHASAEQGHSKVMSALAGTPLLDLGLRLGEGTGAALAIFLMRAACNVFNDMATFDQAGVSGSTS